MKTNIKHGIIFAGDNLIQIRGQEAVISNFDSPLILAFLRNGNTNVVCLDSSSEISWKLTNRRNKLFLECDEYNNVSPVTIETDGTETIRSGKTIPADAPNGSLFYNILEDKIYVRMQNIWQQRSLVLVAEILGMNVMSKQPGKQTATDYYVDSGVFLYDEFGAPIRNSSSVIMYDSIQPFELQQSSYEILPFSTNLPEFSCVYYSNNFIKPPSKYELPNGVIVAKSTNSTLIANYIQINNLSLLLSDGDVFCTESGILSSTPNSKFFCKIGTYDAKNRSFTVDIKSKEHII